MNNLNNNVTNIKVLEAISKLDNTFIPDGTIYNIEADGSGDFETLNEIANFLQDKWSNGTITIQLGEGSFEVESEVMITTNKFIPNIHIKGEGTDKTTVQKSKGTQGNCTIKFTHQNGRVSDITILGEEKTGSSYNFGLTAADISCIKIYNVVIKRCNYGLFASEDSAYSVTGTLDIEDCNVAFEVQNHSKATLGGPTITIKNCNKGFSWFRFSSFCSWATTYSLSGVGTKATTSRNSVSQNGVFYTDNDF